MLTHWNKNDLLCKTSRRICNTIPTAYWNIMRGTVTGQCGITSIPPTQTWTFTLLFATNNFTSITSTSVTIDFKRWTMRLVCVPQKARGERNAGQWLAFFNPRIVAFTYFKTASGIVRDGNSDVYTIRNHIWRHLTCEMNVI